MTDAGGPRVLGPGSRIGILGGGQLARMLAMEARRMGYRVGILDAQPQCPAAELADVQVVAPLDDPIAARELASQVDVLTLDTEHVPWALLARLEQICPVRPGSHVLRCVQDRADQRKLLRELGAPQPAHAAWSGGPIPDRVGFPCVIKTRTHGYDGRGQVVVSHPGEVEQAWERLGRAPAVVEEWIDLEREISAIVSRSVHGDMAFFPIAENEHRDGVLHCTQVPARIDPRLAVQARETAAAIAQALDHVGTMAVEFFVTRDGRLLVNEIAPRTHNSGHYSFGGCSTSQFEQHLRAVCGLPLGDTSLLKPAAMLNLLGELWAQGEPDWSPVMTERCAHLHLYGKQGARRGRKMGHVLILSDDAPHEVAERVSRALARTAHAPR